MTAICSDLAVTVIISTFGIPGLISIPAGFILLAMAWHFAFALIFNDFIKVYILKRFKADNNNQ